MDQDENMSNNSGSDEDFEGNFTVFHDKITATRCSLKPVWCPSMDLLAVVTEEHNLTIFRLPWQKLFTIDIQDIASNDSSMSSNPMITAISWRPDGRVIAIGMDCGSIVLFCVEDGKKLAISHVHKCRITTMDWSSQKEPKINSEENFNSGDRSRVIFSDPLVSIPKVARMGMISAPKGNPPVDYMLYHFTENESMLNVLVSGDCEGRIRMSALGVFPVVDVMILLKRKVEDGQRKKKKRVGLYEDFPCELIIRTTNEIENSSKLPSEIGDSCSVVDVSLCSHLHSLCVTLHSKTTGRVYSAQLDCTILLHKARELRTISFHIRRIDYLLRYILEAMTTIRSGWDQNCRNVMKKFDLIEKVLEEANQGESSNGTPQEELLSLLINGTASQALQLFFAKFVSFESLQKHQKVVEDTCKILLNIIHKNIERASEELLFRISELRGFSLWSEQFNSLGLKKEPLNIILKNSQVLLKKSQELKYQIMEAKEKFSAFFPWIIFHSKNLSDETSAEAINFDVDKIADLLSLDIKNDIISQYFVIRPLPEWAQMKKGINNVNNEAEEEKSSINNIDLLKEWELEKKKSFLTCFQKVQSSWKIFCSTPCKSISSNIKLSRYVDVNDFVCQSPFLSPIPISPGTRSSSPAFPMAMRTFHEELNDSGKQLTAFVHSSSRTLSDHLYGEISILYFPCVPISDSFEEKKLEETDTEQEKGKVCTIGLNSFSGNNNSKDEKESVSFRKFMKRIVGIDFYKNELLSVLSIFEESDFKMSSPLKSASSDSKGMTTPIKSPLKMLYPSPFRYATAPGRRTVLSLIDVSQNSVKYESIFSKLENSSVVPKIVEPIKKRVFKNCGGVSISLCPSRGIGGILALPGPKRFIVVDLEHDESDDEDDDDNEEEDDDNGDEKMLQEIEETINKIMDS